MILDITAICSKSGNTSGRGREEIDAEPTDYSKRSVQHLAKSALSSTVSPTRPRHFRQRQQEVSQPSACGAKKLKQVRRPAPDAAIDTQAREHDRRER